jgi:hypothetical protein
MPTTVLVIERDDPNLKLLAWGLQEEGFDVLTADAPAIPGGDVRPDFIVFNTGMLAEDKKLWVDMMRYLAPGARIIDP